MECLGWVVAAFLAGFIGGVAIAIVGCFYDRGVDKDH